MKRTVRVIPFLFILLTVCAFSGCTPKEGGTPDDFMNVDVITSADGKAYTVKNGCEKGHFSVEDGKPCQVEITVKKQSGTLHIRIEKDEDHKPIYQGKDLPSSQFTVTAEEAGDYTVTVQAKNFVGEYRTELNTAATD